jgi:hypothetical protein
LDLLFRAGTTIAGGMADLRRSAETNPLVGSRYHDGAAQSGTDMCEKCAELDKKIERCERAVVSVGDRATVERLMAMVKDLQAQKAALHPEE